MNSKRHSSQVQLSDRDKKVLDHVVRHRITTNEALHKLFFHKLRPNAVTKVTARLCRSDYLRRSPLRHPRTYFTLGANAVQQFGLPATRSLPLGPQALPIEYAVLAYSTLGTRYHRRLTTAEPRAAYPWYPARLLEQAHCLDGATDAPILELIRPDLGGKADYLARKCLADIRVRLDIPEFQQLVATRRFRLVVVTCSEQKAAAIRSAIDGHMWPQDLQIHLAVVPDLISLTGSLSDGS